MKEFEDISTMRTLNTNAVIDLKLTQLKLLVDPSLDREITWIEDAAVKTPFFDGHTYKTTTFEYLAGPKLIAKIRGHAIVALVNDLSRLGCKGRAREIIYSARVSQPEKTAG